MAGEGDWLLEVALAKGGNAKNAPMTRGKKDGNEPRLCDVRKLESTFILRDLVSTPTLVFEHSVS